MLHLHLHGRRKVELRAGGGHGRRRIGVTWLWALAAACALSGIAASSSLANTTTCRAFVSSKTYCDKPLTAGVTIQEPTSGLQCTAGPLVIPRVARFRQETYVLTAGHCIFEAGGINTRWYAFNLAEEMKEIGLALYYLFKPQDVGVIRISNSGGWLLTTRPRAYGVMAKWATLGKEFSSTSVVGESTPAVRRETCFEGQVTGEACGKVIATQVKSTGVENLIQVEGARAVSGDSGGPFWNREQSDLMLEGTMVGEGRISRTLYFYPLNVAFQELANTRIQYLNLELLTTRNESRRQSPDPHKRALGEKGIGTEIEESEAENVKGEGGTQTLIGKIATEPIVISAKSVQAKGTLYGNGFQGEVKLALTYHEPQVVKPILKECEVKIGASDEIGAEGHLAWKWNGEKKQLEEEKQSSSQAPGMIFTANEILGGETSLPEGTLAEIKLKGAGCGVLAGTFVVKGSLSATIQPSHVEEWGKKLKILFPGWTKQHFWNGDEYVGVEPGLVFDGNSASLEGSLALETEKEEVAIFEE